MRLLLASLLLPLLLFCCGFGSAGFFCYCSAGLPASSPPSLPAPPPPERTALRRLCARADSGNPKALFDLARLHDTGFDSIPVDSIRSTELYRQSADRGYLPALSYLGYRLYRGEGGLPRDPGKGISLIEKAALGGDPKAANNLGWLLLEGSGVEHDPAKAAFWLRQAAQAGLPTAAAMLADLYREGKGVAPDTITAENLYMKAIESGLRDAELKLHSMMRRRWEETPSDELFPTALRLYTGLAPQTGVTLMSRIESDRHSRFRPRAAAILGDAYSRAQGVGYDHDRAQSLLTEAALLGDPSAAFIVGELLDIFPDALADAPRMADSLGVILPADYRSPACWYEAAARDSILDAAAAHRRLLSPPPPVVGLDRVSAKIKTR